MKWLLGFKILKYPYGLEDGSIASTSSAFLAIRDQIFLVLKQYIFRSVGSGLLGLVKRWARAFGPINAQKSQNRGASHPLKAFLIFPAQLNDTIISAARSKADH
jgi:hypothetical protein